MKPYIYKLRFRTPLHIGDSRPNYESCEAFIHSDTLFSALINAWRLIYPEDLNDFFPQPAPNSLRFPFFRISSAFPYVGKELFFPKPQTRPQNQKEESKPGAAKQFKKLTWIGKSHFENCLKGERLVINEKCLSGDKHFLFSSPTDSDRKKLFTIYDSPRIVKDRDNEQTNIFYFARLYCAENAGLYFMATFPDEQWKKKFDAVLNLLGDEGFGGDRSVGNGLFDAKIPNKKSEIHTPERADHFLTLSLYHPRVEELTNNYIRNSSYDLVLRSGWVFSDRGRPIRRNAVRMFTEGSVFPGHAGDFGDVVKVLDPIPDKNLNHAVYRYGQAFSVPIIMPEEKV